MWTVIYITQNKDIATSVKKLLRDAGLLVKIRSVGLRSNTKYGCFEILLPEAEVEEGHNIIIANGI
ncbi:MAG: hypothetical protein IKU15_04195 [Clostridia bacterium]|nr:hypothetical protein [Clostridia bacterium]